jgi:hypothetical protein
MPNPDKLLPLLQRAADYSLRTPGRIGHLIHLNDCSEVLVAGDLHGHIPNFQVILKGADLANHPKRHLVLQEVIHSKFRYPNGGDKSHQLLDLFAALKCQYPTRVHLLPGNHEFAQWTNRAIMKGSDSQNEVFRQGVTAAYGAQSQAIYNAYMELIRCSPLALRTLNGVFLSHSLVPGRSMGLFDSKKLEETSYDPKEYQPGGLVYNLVWGRDTSEQTIADFLRKVDSDWLISGHIPTEKGYEWPNSKQLIVDCAESPAAYVLFPTDRPLTQADLSSGIVVF